MDGGTIRLGKAANVKIGNDAGIGEGTLIECADNAAIVLGEQCELFRYNVISARTHVFVGAHTIVGEFSSIRDSDHEFKRLDIPILSQGFKSQPIDIGEDVWIGRGAAVLKGATIGSHSVIGANSVVTAGIPDWSVAVGAPARVIKCRK